MERLKSTVTGIYLIAKDIYPQYSVEYLISLYASSTLTTPTWQKRQQTTEILHFFFRDMYNNLFLCPTTRLFRHYATSGYTDFPINAFTYWSDLIFSIWVDQDELQIKFSNIFGSVPLICCWNNWLWILKIQLLKMVSSFSLWARRHSWSSATLLFAIIHVFQHS